MIQNIDYFKDFYKKKNVMISMTYKEFKRNMKLILIILHLFYSMFSMT
jgi:hypothetical protein